MAIDIQQPNYSGLVAIAGKNAPLNIAPTGALGLQALQQRQSNEASLREDVARRMQLQQQGHLGLLSNNTQNRALDLQDQQQQRQGLLAQGNQELAQQQLQQQGSQADAENAIKQQQVSQQGLNARDLMDLQNRQLAEDTSKRQMVQLIAENKEKIQEKGSFASYGLLAINGAKSPEESQQIKMEILKEAASKKYMSPEELKAASQMSNSQFQNALKYKVMQFGQVKEYKDMLEAGKEKSSSAGAQTITLADGTVIQTSSPTQGTKTEIQKDIKDNQKAMSQLDKIQEGYDPAYFTYKNQTGASLSKQAEKSKGIPIWEDVTNLAASVITGKNPQERAAFLQKRAAYMNNLEQVFLAFKKEMTGTAAGPSEIENIRNATLNGDMSPSESVGAMDQLRSKYKSADAINKNVLSNGVDASPPGDDGRKQYLRGLKNPDGSPKYSDEEINTYLRSK